MRLWHDIKKHGFQAVYSGIRERSAFSLVEALVVIAIITLISVISIVNFSSYNEGAAVKRSARDLALAIRKAQNMSLAVAAFGVSATVPPKIGVWLTTNSPGNAYFTFRDLNPPNGNGIYDSPTDQKIDTDKVFERNVKISSLTGYSGMSSAPYTVVHIMFVPPEATVSFTDAGGVSIGDRLEILLAASAGSITKKITIRTSGQISIK